MQNPVEKLVEQMAIARRVEGEDEFHREDGDRLARFLLEFGAWLLESGCLPADAKTPPHPIQPIVRDSYGLARFKPNRIVKFLLDISPLDLNKLQTVPGFTSEDWEQFDQLTGLSVDAFTERHQDSDRLEEIDKAADGVSA